MQHEFHFSERYYLDFQLGPEMLNMYIGESEKNIRDLF